MTATFYVGDAIEVMSKLPEKSVDLILTSPPFLALRSYLPADHPDKSLEGGSQATPGEFIDWLLDVAEACARVLAPHGSLCVELGDTYSGSGGAGGDYGESGLRAGQPKFRQGYFDPARGRAPRAAEDYAPETYVSAKGGNGWPLAKSLSLIPETFRFAMVYGHNPHTGRQTEPWRLRNVVRWVRPNPPVGALGDKFRPATSELMVFCNSKDRYFDLDAVRERPKDHSLKYDGGKHAALKHSLTKGNSWGDEEQKQMFDNPAGAPPLDWWKAAEGQDAREANPQQLYEENADHGSISANAPPLDWWNVPLLEGEEETRYGPKPRDITKGIPNKALAHSPTKGNSWGDSETKIMYENPNGAPPLDWWEIPPGGFKGSHYAVFPLELCVKPIKAMCPERVCRTCGQPSRRIVDYERTTTGGDTDYDVATGRTGGNARMKSSHGGTAVHIKRDTTGFSDCGHDNWRPGIVLDPFAGSGTTLAVATGHGRDAIGIDLDQRNVALALDRVGPFILQLGVL